MISAKDRKLVDEILKKFLEASSDWTEIRQKAVQDFRFYDDEQYDDAKARAIAAAGAAPLITNNRLPTYVKNVENQLRAMNIGVNIHPTDATASDQEADKLAGMIRHIEDISGAREVRVHAAGEAGSLVPGWGFTKIVTKYCNNDKTKPQLLNDQELMLECVKDPMTILPDFSGKRMDLEDCAYIFEFEDMTKDKYKGLYSVDESELSRIKEWDLLGAKLARSGWITQIGCRVARYWYKERSKSMFAFYEDGTAQDDYTEETHFSDDIFTSQDIDDPDNPGTTITQNVVTGSIPKKISFKREIEDVKVCWVDTNGYEILNSGEWHNGEYPFTMYVGNERVVDGKRKIHGIIHYCKDAQKMLNYMYSQFVRKTSAANRSPTFVDERAIPDEYKHMWESANTQDWPFLPFRGVDDAGSPITTPIVPNDRTEPAVQGLLAGGQMFEQAIKMAFGTFDAGLGKENGEQSGIAIQTLAQNGMEANAHYSNNMVISVRAEGKKLLNLIPVIYDRPERWVRIIGADGKPDLIMINAMIQKGSSKGKYYDIANSTGIYDVVVDTGQTYATKKAQQSQQLIEFTAAYPAIAPIIADLVAENMDWDVSHALAERLKMWMQATNPWMNQNADQSEWPPEAKAAVAKGSQDLQTAQQHLAVLNQEYQKLLFDQKANTQDNAAKIELQKMKGESALEIKQLDAKIETMTARMQAIHDRTELMVSHIETMSKLAHEEHARTHPVAKP